MKKPRVIASMLAPGAAGAVVAVAVGAAGAAPQTATLGSTTGSPNANICFAMITCTYVPFSTVANPELVVPFDGTVTSFSVKSMNTSGSVELRVLRPAAGGQYTGAGTSAAEPLTVASPGVNTFSVSLPVKAGDVLGLDNDSSALIFEQPDSPNITAYYQPGLGDGQTAAPNNNQTNYRLLLSATVTATTTTTGTTSTTGTTTNTNPPPRPTLTNVSQAHGRWREGSKLAKFASVSAAPVGTTFRLTLSVAATVKFAFKQQRCGHRCAHGTLSYSATAGAHKLRFQGQISRKRRLRPGHYKLTITATAGGMTSAPQTLRFTIVGS
jgi:hypothetical protein